MDTCGNYSAQTVPDWLVVISGNGCGRLVVQTGRLDEQNVRSCDGLQASTGGSDVIFLSSSLMNVSSLLS